MPESYSYDIASSGLAASGAVSSAISSITVGICEVAKVSDFWTRTATIAAGGLSGGITSTMAGGDFWDGVCNGLICAGLNHAMHMVVEVGAKGYHKLLNGHKMRHHRQSNSLSVYDNTGYCKANSAANLGSYYEKGGDETYYYGVYESAHAINKNLTMSQYLDECGFANYEADADWTPEQFGQELDKGNPVVFVVGNGVGGGHSITLLATRFTETGWSFLVSDPMETDFMWVNSDKYTYLQSYIITGTK